MMVLVTGAAGHVGGALVRTLLERGRAVQALVHRDLRALGGLDVACVAGDVRDVASLQRAFHGADVVYHAAGYVSLLLTEGRRLREVNVSGTRNVVAACLHCGVHRLVHFSSIHALQQEPLDVPLDESRPLANSWRHAPYDRSKAAAEREVQRGVAQGLDAVVLNPTAIIGPYDYRPSHCGEMLLALRRRRLPGLVPGGFDWVDVRDVAEAALRAEEWGATGARYILSGHWASARQIASMVAAITGVPAPRLTWPTGLAYLGAPFSAAFARLTGRRPLYTIVSLRTLNSNRAISHRRAARDLGYHPRPLEETLADTLHWFEEHGRVAEER